jgi:hypothetical protein
VSRFSADVPPIVAVDFDGTLVEAEEYGCFVETYRPIKRMIARVKLLHKIGCSLVLWTCWSGELLEQAKRELLRLEIIDCFDAFNAPSRLQTFRCESPKIYYDYIIDDNLQPDLEDVWRILIAQLYADPYIKSKWETDEIIHARMQGLFTN